MGLKSLCSSFRDFVISHAVFIYLDLLLLQTSFNMYFAKDGFCSFPVPTQKSVFLWDLRILEHPTLWDDRSLYEDVFELLFLCCFLGGFVCVFFWFSLTSSCHRRYIKIIIAWFFFSNLKWDEEISIKLYICFNVK